MTALMISSVLAKAAPAATLRIRACVSFVVFVAVLAVSQGAVACGSGFASDFANIHAALKIDAPCDRLQVLRVHAAADAAQMIQVESFRDRTDELAVRQTVRKFGNWMPGGTDSESRVALSIDPPEPQPTAGIGFRHGVPQDSRGEWFGFSHGGIVNRKAESVMNQTLQYEVDSVMPLAVATGLFVSLCTIQQPSTTPNPDGTMPNSYSDIGGLVNIPCMDAVPSESRIQATETKQLQEILSKQLRHVLLNGFYSTIPSGVGKAWRAVVDGVTYDLLGAEPDSQSQMTRLMLQLATV
jgi:hypothetical protein